MTKDDDRRPTFKVDNQIAQYGPHIFGAKTRRTQAASQLYLPSLEPLTTFDLWTTLALFFKVDPSFPYAEVEIHATDLLRLLEFSRQAAAMDNGNEGYETYRTDQYQPIHRSLQKLFSHVIRLPGELIKTGKYKGHRLDYQGRILSSLGYVTKADGAISPREIDPDSWENTNLVTDDPNYAIWIPRGRRIVAIRYTLTQKLVNGLTQEGPNIGATIFPMEVFSLYQTTIGRSPTATRLLVWVCRQTRKTIWRRLDSLANELSLRSKDKNQNRQALLKGLSLLEEHGVIDSFAYEPEADHRVTVRKAAAWHFPKGSTSGNAKELPKET